MHKAFYIKQQNHDNEGSKIKLSDEQSPWKVPVPKWIEYLVD